MVEELFTGFLKEEHAEADKKPLDLDLLIRILGAMKKRLDGDTSFASPWGSFFTKGSWDDDSKEGYFWTENKRYLLFFITPKKIDTSFANAQPSLLALRKAIAQVKADFPDVNVGVTGQEALNVDEMGEALHDMGLATMISLSGLMLLLVVSWHGFRWPLFEVIQMIIDLSLTFGLATLFIGHLNILSVTFAPMLLGLGIDYGIHVFSRYQEEEQRLTSSKKEALQATIIKLGPAILLAGLTAAFSFLPLVLTGFKGLMELGFILSMGLVLSTLSSLCLLPALSLVFDKSRQKIMTQVHPKPVKPFFKLTNQGAFLFLIVGCIGVTFALWGAKKVRFDLNMLRLQSKEAESVIWEKKLLADSKRSSMYGAILAQSLEEVYKKTAALKFLATVSEVQSIGTLLPQEQEEKINFLRKLKPLVPEVRSPQSLQDPIDLAEINTILKKINFKMLDSSSSQWGSNKPLELQMTQVRNLIGELQQCFQSMTKSRVLNALQDFEKTLIKDLNEKLDLLRSNANATPMHREDLPKALLERFVSKDNHYLIRVSPSQNIWEPELLGRFVHDLRSVDPDAVGDPVTLYVFTKAFRNACIKATIYAVVFIFFLLLLTFRSFIYTLMALTPFVVGTTLTIGLLGFFGVNLNLANAIFLPLVVSAGIEYGIIIVQRWRQRESTTEEMVLPRSTAKGVMLAGLSTTIGFGSLMISAHQGIYSLGLLATVGSLSILAAAIFFLPRFCNSGGAD